MSTAALVVVVAWATLLAIVLGRLLAAVERVARDIERLERTILEEIKP